MPRLDTAASRHTKHRRPPRAFSIARTFELDPKTCLGIGQSCCKHICTKSPSTFLQAFSEYAKCCKIERISVIHQKFQSSKKRRQRCTALELLVPVGGRTQKCSVPQIMRTLL